MKKKENPFLAILVISIFTLLGGVLMICFDSLNFLLPFSITLSVLSGMAMFVSFIMSIMYHEGLLGGRNED